MKSKNRVNLRKEFSEKHMASLRFFATMEKMGISISDLEEVGNSDDYSLRTLYAFRDLSRDINPKEAERLLQLLSKAADKKGIPHNSLGKQQKRFSDAEWRMDVSYDENIEVTKLRIFFRECKLLPQLECVDSMRLPFEKLTVSEIMGLFKNFNAIFVPEHMWCFLCCYSILEKKSQEEVDRYINTMTIPITAAKSFLDEAYSIPERRTFQPDFSGEEWTILVSIKKRDPEGISKLPPPRLQTILWKKHLLPKLAVLTVEELRTFSRRADTYISMTMHDWDLINYLSLMPLEARVELLRLEHTFLENNKTACTRDLSNECKKKLEAIIANVEKQTKRGE